MPEAKKIKVGQVWEDNDRRLQRRRLQIKRIYTKYDHNTYKDQEFAECELLTGDKKGKISHIRVDRFKPTSTGYKLVKDVREATATP